MKKLITALALLLVVSAGVWILAGKQFGFSTTRAAYHAPFQHKGDPDALESAEAGSNQRAAVSE